MSRTIRRKAIKPTYFNFDSEAEFNFALDCYKSNAPNPQYIRPYVERSLVRALNPWGRYSWVEAPYGSPEYKKFQQKSAEWWYEYRTSNAYVAHAARNEYERRGAGKQSYSGLIAKQTAVFHSDAGYGVHKHTVPRDFRHTFTKADRQRTRALIYHGIANDSWDELLFPKAKTDAGWWYW